jgi:alkylated DNA repair dioxygenase AlkB
MPTIASLTLGAERIFRIKKIVSDDNEPSTFDISLPHNSLLIMLPPFQVLLDSKFLGGVQARNP